MLSVISKPICVHLRSFELEQYSDSLFGGAAVMLEPIMLRSNSKRDTFAWKRGETTASAGQLIAFNALTAEALAKQAVELVG